MGILNNMVGSKFGRLHIHERSKDNKYHVLVTCECDPSVEYYTNGYGIHYGRTLSCGCLERENSMLSKSIGKKIGRLTIHSRTKDGYVMVSCECSPSERYEVYAYSILDGSTKSCGCLKSEVTATRNKDNSTHGLSGTKIYDVWRQMIDRCENKDNKGYKYYGGKGVSVCNEWKDVSRFKEWADNNGYIVDRGLSIDRIDTEGDYEPDNCRWITLSENIAKRNRENAKNVKNEI